MSKLAAFVIAPARLGEGGQGAAARDMAAALGARGMDCKFVGLPESGALRRIASRRPLRRFGSLSRDLERRAVMRRVPARWDIAYAMPGFLPSPMRGVRVLHHATHHPRRVVEDVDRARSQTGGGRGFITNRELRRLEGEIAAADLIRAESQAVADGLVGHGVPRSRVVFAPPGVDLERFRPAEKNSELTVAFVGVLALWKGVDVLVELAHRLQGRANVAVIGGPVCPWSRRLVAGAPLQHHDDVSSLLARAHALVLPSVTDGFGYVVLEALASGTVPFVSPRVGAAEIVSRLDPRLVQPREAFARVVPRLLEDLDLEELGRRGRVLADDFDQRAMADAAADAVLRAAAGLRRPRSPAEPPL